MILANSDPVIPSNYSFGQESAIGSKTVTRSLFKRSLEKITSVAKEVFKGVTAAGLYWLNPSLFAVGVLIGIGCDIQMRSTVDKIYSVWHKQPWTTTLLLAFGAILSLPVILAAGSFICGADIGSSLSQGRG